MNKTTQKLNLFSLTMIVIGFVIGMGIFRTAATSAKDAISPSVYFSAWAIGGLVALCGALTYAEIGSRYPVTGGYYKVFAKAYHPSIAFAINCIILVSNAASVSGVALIGSGYLLKLFPGAWTDIDKALVSSAAIIIFYIVNLKGLKTSSTAQNILMMIKITMVIVLISALFFPDKYAVDDAAKAVAAPAQDFTWLDWVKSLGVSLIAVSFTYGGYQQTINLGNDVHQPSKNIPRGIFIGILIVIGLYMLVNLSYFTVVGFNQMIRWCICIFSISFFRCAGLCKWIAAQQPPGDVCDGRRWKFSENFCQAQRKIKCYYFFTNYIFSIMHCYTLFFAGV